MSGIPEDVTTVSGEAPDLKGALADAAEKLGVEIKRVQHKLDLAHFRTGAGRSLARSTVKIIAWAGPEVADEPQAVEINSETEARPEREARPRFSRNENLRGRRRDPREDGEAAPTDSDAPSEEAPPKREGLRGPEGAPTEASGLAKEWFQTLLGFMEVEGSISDTGSDTRVHLALKADKAGRVIGRRGATLDAIRHLLRMMLGEKYGVVDLDVDVADERPREPGESRFEGRSDRRDDRRGPPRDDRRGPPRDDRRGPPRDDRRGPPRDDRRGPPRDDRDDRRPSRPDDLGPKSDPQQEEKLKTLARRAAEKAIQTGKTVTINLLLNSYDRRIIHLAVADIDGVQSRSEERDGTKYIQVVPKTA